MGRVYRSYYARHGHEDPSGQVLVDVMEGLRNAAYALHELFEIPDQKSALREVNWQRDEAYHLHLPRAQKQQILIESLRALLTAAESARNVE